MQGENGIRQKGNFEIGQIFLEAARYCACASRISNPEIRNVRLNCDDLEVLVQFEISDFGI